MFSDFQDLITAKTQKMLNSEWVVRVHATYVQIWPLVSFLYCLSLSLCSLYPNSWVQKKQPTLSDYSGGERGPIL